MSDTSSHSNGNSIQSQGSHNHIDFHHNDWVDVPTKKAKHSSSSSKKHAKDAKVNDRKSSPEETAKATPIPKVAAAASANNSLHFNDEDEEEEEGEVKSNAPVKSNDSEYDEDRVDDKDSGPITKTKEEQSAFNQEHFEVIPKCRFNFRANNKEWHHKPIRRDKKNVPIGRGSFFQRESFDYSQAKIWASQGHKDRVRTVNLTFVDRQRRIVDDDCSVQTLILRKTMTAIGPSALDSK